MRNARPHFHIDASRTEPVAKAAARMDTTTDPLPRAACIGRIGADVAKGVASERELRSVARRIGDETVQRLGAHVALMFLFDRERAELRVAAHHNVPPELLTRMDHLGLNAPLLAARSAARR